MNQNEQAEENQISILSENELVAMSNTEKNEDPGFSIFSDLIGENLEKEPKHLGKEHENLVKESELLVKDHEDPVKELKNIVKEHKHIVKTPNIEVKEHETLIKEPENQPKEPLVMVKGPEHLVEETELILTEPEYFVKGPERLGNKTGELVSETRNLEPPVEICKTIEQNLDVKPHSNVNGNDSINSERNNESQSLEQNVQNTQKCETEPLLAKHQKLENDELTLNGMSDLDSVQLATKNRHVSFQKPLGDMKPIYRLSMRLPQKIFESIDIPNADKHRHIEKSGYLQKLCGRSFPYLHQWRRRYCVLSKGKLFFYEKEDSRGSDKSSGVIDLKYFDHVIEASSKDAKKATNVFVITAQDRSFFDPGRYLLSAETLTDMNDWIQRLREALEQIKNNNRPLRKDERKEAALLKEASKDTTHQSSPGKKDEDQVDSKRSKMDNPAAASAFEKRKAELHARLAAPKASSSIQARSSALKMEDDGKGKFNRAPQDELCPLKDDAKPLESITKYRAKGPAGRRAPNARRTALMKQRASSLSALQQGHPGEDPTRSGSPYGNRLSSITTDGLAVSDRDSRGSFEFNSSCDQFGFGDIDSDLFFKRPELILEADEGQGDVKESNSKYKSSPKRSKLTSRVSQIFSKRPSSCCSNKDSDAVAVNRRETFISRFRTINSPVRPHPDEKRTPRRCTIL